MSERRPVPGREAVVEAVARAGRPGGTADDLAWVLMAIAGHDDRTDAMAVQELAGVGARTWLELDAAVRRGWWNSPAGALPPPDRGGALSTLLDAFHPDGHLRQAAVARLADLDDGVALPALAIRTTDWVPQVRDAARAVVAARLSSVDALLAIGPVAVLLTSRARGPWLGQRLAAAVAGLDDAGVGRLLGAGDDRVRRLAVTALLDQGRLSDARILDVARHDADLVVRTRCATAAIRAAARAGRLDVLRSLTTSGTAAVRADAVWALASVGETAPAVTALLDRSPAVREVAQVAGRRVGDDPATHYRALVAAGDDRPAAVAGLGETGSRADAAAITPFLAAVRPAARREAVRALRRLGAVDVATLTRLLTDPSPAVTRQVVLALLPHAGDLDDGWLVTLLGATVPPHVRFAAYRLRRARDVWSRLITDLELWDDPQLHRRVRADLTGWLLREAATSYASPPADVRRRLDGLVERVRPSIGPDRARTLRFHLGLPVGPR